MKKTVSFLLALCMLVGLFFVQISAVEYQTENYAEQKENGFAKLEGAGSTLTLTEIDGGEKGGKIGVTIEYAPEPEAASLIGVIVNGKEQAEFAGEITASWFEVKTKKLDLTLQRGKTNTIEIVIKEGKIVHFRKVILDVKAAASRNTTQAPVVEVKGDMGGIPMTEYNCGAYATETEKDIAKLNGQGTSVLVKDIDGGVKGGITNVVMTYCTEPNEPTAFDILVNSEKQFSFTADVGTTWFEMKIKKFQVKLKAGKTNTIEIVNARGKVSHISTLVVGDVSMDSKKVDEVKMNNNIYNFMDTKPRMSEVKDTVTYAKLEIVDSAIFTNVDGGKGGLCTGFIRSTTQPNMPTKLRISVNENKSITVQTAGTSSIWFEFFNTVFTTFLNPGKTNTVKVDIVEGGLTHFDVIAFGKTDGSTQNPFNVVPGKEIGEDKAAADNAGEFLASKGLLKGSNGDLMLNSTLKRQDCVVIISRLMGFEKEAASYNGNAGFHDIKNEFYNSYVAWAKDKAITLGVGDGNFGFDMNVTQRQFLAMLIRAMGYTNEDVPYDSVIKFCETNGIVSNVQTDSYNEYDMMRKTMAAYIYNALTAKCSDGAILAKKLGIELENKKAYGVILNSQNEVSSVNQNNAKVASKVGMSIVSTNDRYKRFEMTTDVKTKKLNSMILGFRVKSASHQINDSGVWVRMYDKNVELSSDGKTVPIEIPMGLFNTIEGVKLKVVDNGDTINFFSIIGNAVVPFFEVRFEEGYAVGYVKGHIVDGVKVLKLENSGHIMFGSYDGETQYSNITITSTDPVQNLQTEYPLVNEGTYFTANENFEDSIYDYNMFFGTGGGLSVSGGKLNFKTVSRENIFSSIMRLKNATIEGEIEGVGDVEFQIGAGSNTAEGYYYCGMRFTIMKNKVVVYHDTNNMDIEATTDNLERNHNLDLSNGYSAKLSDIDNVISLSIKPEGEKQYTEIVRCIKKTDYISILDSNFDKEEAHYDKLSRDFGYVRIVSRADITLDNCTISGEPYIPFEQMKLNKAPEPDKGKKFEVDDYDTVVGIGYFPYFTRYKQNGVPATRPSIEALLPAVLEASKLTDDERERAFDKLYWGYAWWAEPAQGMYCCRDKWAVKKNLEMIGAAGIDFIYIDNTNFAGGCTPDDILTNIDLIFKCLLELESEGKPYPKACFWNNVKQSGRGLEDTPKETWQIFISNPKYKNLWVYYHGKPLMIYTFSQPMPYVGMEEVAEIREMWTQGGKNKWVFHNDPPQMEERAGYDANGDFEELDILPYGKTTFGGNVTNLNNVVENGNGGREGGKFYMRYWEKAFKTRPKFALIWAYNHWDVNFYRPDKAGNVVWHDNFNYEYSGGIEPIKNNFVYQGKEYPGNSYYEWTKKYVKAYKENKPMPTNLFVEP